MMIKKFRYEFEYEDGQFICPLLGVYDDEDDNCWHTIKSCNGDLMDKPANCPLVEVKE